MTEFRILGPLEVRDERGPIALGGIKVRAVLAALLVHANEPVSADRLAVGLWGEEAPAGAVATVRVHVSRLRKALADADILTTTAAGYRLRVRPGELDAERFERLVQDGRRTLAGGDAESAAAMLREALALWRGPAMADLASEPIAQAESPGLEEQRLSALEVRIDADLAAGRHAELVGELQRLVTAHPGRERPAAQLMLALYRSGRQGEALEAYRAARRRLVSELGIEPGPDLRELHEAVLRQDPRLELHLPQPELPPELEAATGTALVGRVAELERLRRRWQLARAGTGAVVVLTGPPGMGKTRLAAEVASEAHRDGAVVRHAGAATEPEAAVAALRVAGQPSGPALLVLDDADRAPPGVLAALQELAKTIASVPAVVLATAERPEGLAGLAPDETVALDPLDLAAVATLAGAYTPPNANEGPPAAWLADAAGGVPQRVHELASQWARREAARRVGAVAERTAAGRTALRTMEAELAGDVIDLQTALAGGPRGNGGATTVVCPYKGLASFDTADAPYYFGRERLIAEVVARMVGTPLVAIVGSSGSGKSSLLRAGLLPALADGVLPGSEAWEQAVFRPGAHPLGELRRAAAGLGRARRIVLAVDQFEETFSTCRDESERAGFVQRLVDAAADPDGRALVLVAIRADSYGRCAAYPELARLLAANHVLMRVMDGDELRRAIVGPAERAGLEVEAELVEALVADVEREPGSLPLLSTALLDLWQRRDGRRLRHARYEQTGGVRGAVARLAEDAFEQLSPDGQTVARDVLLRLVQEGEGGVVERRRVALAELETGPGEAAAVVSQLTAHRILTADAETVELTHEALLREWPRLRAWIEEEREALGTQRRLAFAASEWQRLGNDEDALYRGTRLAEAEAWRNGHDASLADVERGFLDASGRRRDRERGARRRRVWLAFTALGVAVLALSAVALVAVDESRQALRERNIAVSGRLAAAALDSVDDDPGRAVELARRAVRTAPIAPADAALRQAVLSARELAVLRPSGGSVLGADVTSDGRRAVTASDDGRLRLWDLRTQRLVATYAAHRGKAFMPRFGGDDRWIASAGEDGALAVTGTASGRTRVLARDPRTMATSVAVSPHGAAVAAGYADGTVRTAAVTGGRPARVLGGRRGLVARIAFSGDGRHLAAASWDGTAQMWDLGGNGPPVVLRTDPEGVGAVAFVDQGRLVVVGDAHGRLRFSDTATGRPAGTERVNDLAIDAMPVSADGALIASVDEDGAIRVFDATARRQTMVLRGHRDRLNDADFAARGHVLITTGADGTVRTWDVGGTTVLPGRAVGLSLSHDGQRLAVTGPGPRLRVWNPRTGRPAATIAAGGEPASARLSRDGTRIAVAFYSGDVAVWDVGTGERVETFRDNGKQAYAVAFDGTGRRLVTGGTNGRVVIRDLAGGRPIVLTGHRRTVEDVTFDPDGERVMSAGSDGTVRVWDLAPGRRAARERRAEHVLAGHRGGVNTAVFSADGEWAASAGQDGTIRLWRLADGRATVLRGHDGPVTSAAFSPRGDRIASTGLDGTLRIWDPRRPTALVTLLQRPSRLSGAAWAPDGASVMSAGADGVWMTPCEVCGSLAGVLRLAAARAAR